MSVNGPEETPIDVSFERISKFRYNKLHKLQPKTCDFKFVTMQNKKKATVAET